MFFDYLENEAAGHSLLEIGGDGRFGRRAARGGLATWSGCCLSAEGIERNHRLLSSLDNRPDFRSYGSLEALPEGIYDHVVCADVLDCVDHPFAFLDRLTNHCRRTLTITQRPVGGRWTRRLLEWLAAARSVHSAGRPFQISCAAVRAQLARTGVYASLEATQLPDGERILVGRRFSPQHLVVLAGPTSAGKSTALAQLAQQPPAALAAWLESRVPRPWTLAQFADAASLESVCNLIVHYDFLGPAKRDAHDLQRGRLPSGDRQRQRLSRWAEAASSTQWLTIVTPAPYLRQQFEANELQGLQADPYRQQLWQHYQDPGQVRRLYEDWFDRSQDMPGVHWAVRFRPDFHLLPADQWRHLLDADTVGQAASAEPDDRPARTIKRSQGV